MWVSVCEEQDSMNELLVLNPDDGGYYTYTSICENLQNCMPKEKLSLCCVIKWAVPRLAYRKDKNTPSGGDCLCSLLHSLGHKEQEGEPAVL